MSSIRLCGGISFVGEIKDFVGKVGGGPAGVVADVVDVVLVVVVVKVIGFGVVVVVVEVVVVDVIVVVAVVDVLAVVLGVVVIFVVVVVIFSVVVALVECALVCDCGIIVVNFSMPGFRGLTLSEYGVIVFGSKLLALVCGLVGVVFLRAMSASVLVISNDPSNEPCMTGAFSTSISGSSSAE
uniref:Uncharacterized protein n=1 Tax=Glossina brevipalpis TaxID=37001 RepID=A0A1A9W3Z3_9MUSC